MDIPPVFHETEDSKVDMITVFVSDSQEVGHRKIVLLPGPDVPQIWSKSLWANENEALFLQGCRM